MRILYDGQSYALQRSGGINRYFDNIIRRLPQDCHPTLTAPHHASTEHYPTHPKLKIYRCPDFNSSRLVSKLDSYYFRFLNSIRRFDCFHPTYYTTLLQRDFSSYSCPIVLTVHDFVHEIFAATIDPTGEKAAVKRKAILSAQALICVSENTKKDLLNFYPVAEEKVFVTHHASDINHTLAYGSEAVPERPYYLYVGSRKIDYKNFDGLLRAFSKAFYDQPDVALCVVGNPLNDEEWKLIHDLNLAEKVEVYQQVNDTHLAKLYRCSIAFIYPSLYEGFGIPLLEAMACETAVIASNTSCFPEVVGDAGILFNPRSIADLAEILKSFLTEVEARKRLIERGTQRVKAFSWDTAASRTLEIYRSTI
ncbi:glycosyltransferase family 4 protein [Phormidesmis sp. 146-33]